MAQSRPRMQTDDPRLSPGLLAGVAVVHAGILAALLQSPPSIAPIKLPQTMTVSLIEPEIETPQPEPRPEFRPQPPKPVDRPLPPPPVLAAERPQATPRSVVETPEPAPAPEPESLPLPAPVVEAPRPAPPPPAPIPPRPADYLNTPRPPYPSLSRRQGEQGIVRLNILVNPDGSVARLELLKSSGYPRLDRSAMETVQSSWKFEPARQGGNPVAAWVIVPIQFTLRS
jgi:protein TonB